MNLFGTIRAPRELIFGCGQRHALGRIASTLGKRALVVTDARLATDADFLAMVEALQQAGLAVRVDSSTLTDVPVETAVAFATHARDFAPDLLFGTGARKSV